MYYRNKELIDDSLTPVKGEGNDGISALKTQSMNCNMEILAKKLEWHQFMSIACMPLM